MLFRKPILSLSSLIAFAGVMAGHSPLLAAEFEVKVSPQIEYKAVFGKVESRDIVPARARLGGTIVSLAVTEGTAVKAGDVVAVVVDDKLALQLDAAAAQSKALNAQLVNTMTELDRARKLFAGGVASKAAVDSLKTQVDVLSNQLNATKSQSAVLSQQSNEGKVLSPASGRVLSVPVTKGSVIMPGEPVARIASGGYFLRLSLPERHAANIHQGDAVRVGARGLDIADGKAALREGKLVKVYPEINAGEVQADVEVEGLGDFFVGERTLVWIPVERRDMLAIPPQAIINRHGIDYVKLIVAEGEMEVAVITGETLETPDGQRTEILSGIKSGDKVVTP